MPLKHYCRKFFVDPDKIEDSDLIKSAKKKMGNDLYNLAVSVFERYIRERDIDVSRGYFKFAFIMGHESSEKNPDVPLLWKRMEKEYGSDDAAADTVHRVLGTICMICVARDPRRWVYVEDEDKRLKLSLDKVPEPNQYFIGDYKVPKDLSSR